ANSSRLCQAKQERAGRGAGTSSARFCTVSNPCGLALSHRADKFFVNRVEPLVARIEVVVRGIELAGVESMPLDAALNFPDRCLDVAERINAARQCEALGSDSLDFQKKIIGRVGSGVVRVNPAMIGRHDAHHIDADLIHLVYEPFADGHRWTIVGPLMDPSPHAIKFLDPPDRVMLVQFSGVHVAIDNHGSSSFFCVPTKAWRRLRSRSKPDTSAERSGRR